MKKKKEIVLYQGKNGMIEFRGDFLDENYIWGTQKQISELFEIERSVITKHINKILKDGEVKEKSNVQKMHIANSDKPVKFYSLDIILAVGYKTNSSKATNFRKWATKTLKQHITQGFTINQKRIKQNHQEFLKTVEDIKLLVKNNQNLETNDVLELIKSFSYTWFSLERYDKDNFPKQGTKKSIQITAKELHNGLVKLKKELINKKEAAEIFGQERERGKK